MDAYEFRQWNDSVLSHPRDTIECGISAYEISLLFVVFLIFK